MRQRSPCFEMIYDESAPANLIGSDIHYSVVQCLQWFDTNGKQFQDGRAKLQDIGILWDGDHDTRVMDVLAAAYLRKLLAPVLFINEHKGHLTILLDSSQKIVDEETYRKSWLDCLAYSNDNWTMAIDLMEVPSEISGLRGDALRTYLQNIGNMWLIGLNELSI